MEDLKYPVLVDDIDDDNEAAIVLAVVHEGHPPDLHKPLERLHKNNEASSLTNTTDAEEERRRLVSLPSWRRRRRRRREAGGRHTMGAECG